MGVVHFTHHLCRAIASEKGCTERESYMLTTRLTDEDYKKEYGSNIRSPMACECSTEKAATRPRFTTNPRAVTCRPCRNRLACGETYWQRDHRDRPQWTWREWTSDAVLVERAWLMCCRHHGAPSPFSPEETNRLLRAIELRPRLAPLRTLSTAYTVTLVGVSNGREFIEKSMAALDPEMRTAMAPLLERCGRMASELVTELKGALDQVGDRIGRISGEESPRTSATKRTIAKKRSARLAAKASTAPRATALQGHR